MRINPEIERYRITKGQFASGNGKPFGFFFIPFEGRDLKVMACDVSEPPMDWDHVSVSLPNRCPNWREMCYVKNLFWPSDTTVLQFHPAASEYINLHPHCLHLWKKSGVEHELPPSIMVGPNKGLECETRNNF